MDTETNVPTIRQATVRDAQGVVNVINSVILEGGLTALYPTFTVEDEERYIRGLGSRSAIFVAEVDGRDGNEIVGLQTIAPFAEYTRAMDHVAEIGTFVHSDYRRQGVGRMLFEHTLTFARQRGYEKLMLSVRAGNASGIEFYRKMGFAPKLILERQVKIGGEYDDQVLMERFIAPADQVAGVELLAVEEPAMVEPPAPIAEPAVVRPEAAVAPARPTTAVDPVVGAVTVRRAKRQDLRVLVAIMRGTVRWRTPPSETEVLDMLYDKGYWLAMSRKGGGLTGWRAENLVMCIDDFYVYPAQYYPQVGGPLLETIETEAQALSCEVAIVFLEEEISPEAIDFFTAQGYKLLGLDDLYNVWREVAQEFLTDGRFMMVKQLRQDRVMRPL
jgi:ribosomal protein S18 acetylase RimI-like enzyme